jgi:hypothetical protein
MPPIHSTALKHNDQASQHLLTGVIPSLMLILFALMLYLATFVLRYAGTIFSNNGTWLLG